jgi:hypothetical protein
MTMTAEELEGIIRHQVRPGVWFTIPEVVPKGKRRLVKHPLDTLLGNTVVARRPAPRELAPVQWEYQLLA